jgi:hypothetical protein
VPHEASACTKFSNANVKQLAGFLTLLGHARVGSGDDAERYTLAEANLLEAHSIYLAAKDRGPAHKETLECVRVLGDLYEAWDRAQPGKGFDAKAATWRATLDAAEMPAVDSKPK